jgi:NitT/TauT family transport system substrate-binding protein
VIAVLGLATMAAACGDSASESGASAATSDAGTPTVELAITSSEMPVAVAVDEGLFEGVDVKYQLVGFDAKTPLFLKSSDMPITELSPVEVAQEIAKGEDIVYFSTSTGLYFWNGILIRAEDAERFKSIEDLKGLKLGQPGFGTGTWAAFSGLTKSLYGIDARKDFKLVTADPGALIGLLASGKIDAALTFAGQAATGMASDDFRLMASLGGLWEEKTGQPPLVDGLVARRDWLEQNPDVARKVAEGIDRGVEWMKEHPEEFAAGGKYEKIARDGSWLTDQKTTDQIVSLLKEGKWYATSEAYTQEWVDSMYDFVDMALDGTGEKMPAKSELFAPVEGTP